MTEPDGGWDNFVGAMRRADDVYSFARAMNMRPEDIGRLTIPLDTLAELNDVDVEIDADLIREARRVFDLLKTKLNNGTELITPQRSPDVGN